ncbi:glycosyltransferase [Marinilongibacter aquaticus]|uniref:glycosyltransferase n=1 Tax=Marinilongibacter aquaticus TaxID=2975157 RepID=UPI0021BD6802|nr:glycosyltransferase [Marinilongibacter aquaticus]UBM57236.1 glycosyltransferase [Marinilongibacter aquaticus]
MKISVIIPTFNEAGTITRCLTRLFDAIGNELVDVLIVDSPESEDNIESVLCAFPVKYVVADKAGRNHQMNEGALYTKSSILYFVHADTLVHPHFVKDILAAIDQGVDMGCYRYKFDAYPYFLMYINSFFTRFPMIWCRGGDQTLFVRREAFESLQGFSAEHVIMEDYDILLRSKGSFRFKIIPKDVVVSARKYKHNSYWKVLKANYIVMNNWMSKKKSPQELRTLYKELLNKSK